MNILKNSIVKYVLAHVLLLVSSLAFAGPVLDFTGGTPGNNDDQNIGWQFDVNSAITVTELTWADIEMDGLSFAHEIGIWDSSGALLTSTTIQAGTASTLNGVWRTEDIVDIVLAAGTGYIVGGLNVAGGDVFVFDVATLVLNADINFVDATFSDFTTTFGRPTQFSQANTGFFGPSFNVASVPEPTSIALLGIGLIGLGIARRKKAA